MKSKGSTAWAETECHLQKLKLDRHITTALQDWLWRQNKTETKQEIQLWETCLHAQTYDGLPLNSFIHCTSICFANQSDIFPEKLLARQSCADSWRQHIKGLRGSAVSINGLSRSFLPSGSSAQCYIITLELPATERRGQTFKGNGIGSKQRYYCYSQHQRWTVSVACHTYRALVSLRGKIALCVCPLFGILFICLVVSLDFSISDRLYDSSYQDTPPPPCLTVTCVCLRNVTIQCEKSVHWPYKRIQIWFIIQVLSDHVLTHCATNITAHLLRVTWSSYSDFLFCIKRNPGDNSNSLVKQNGCVLRAADGWKMQIIWSVCSAEKFSLSPDDSFSHNM